jgi:endo-1,4-beta-xylanase
VPLKELAVRTGRYFGTCAQLQNLLDDPSYAALVTQQCSVLVPENELKWGTLRPSPTQPFNFTPADLALSFAEQHGMRVRGSCFTWTNDVPWWFDTYVTPQNALQILEEHITTVMTRYKGRIFSWDVANEATYGGGYYPTPWAKLLGPRYVDNAFTIAHRADPSAQLLLNEYNLEYSNAYSQARQRSVLRILDDLLSRGIPVHGLGVQGHLEWAAMTHQFDPRQHRSFLRSVAAMGLRVVITELDVTDVNLPGDPAVRDRGVAAAYERYLDTVLQEPCVDGLVSWGLSDKYSWINSANEARFQRADRQLERPLPFDGGMAPKAACDATARALLHATGRVAR